MRDRVSIIRYKIYVANLENDARWTLKNPAYGALVGAIPFEPDSFGE